tara:strand:+ start:39 stop:332 length:294 start_codon:yes stop_codon:yes gene_type:complete
MKPTTKMKKNLEKVKKLAKLALTNNPILEPSKGYIFLKDVKLGNLVKTQSNTEAIVIDQTTVSTYVLVTKIEQISSEDKSFYLGRHRWSSLTEVKII